MATSANTLLVGTAFCGAASRTYHSSPPTRIQFVCVDSSALVARCRRNLRLSRTEQCRTRTPQRKFLGSIVSSMRDAEQLVRSGVVRTVGPEEVSALVSQEGGFKILDVRPVWEREKAFVRGSYHVPLFIEDVTEGPLTLLRKTVQFGQGGWWIGLKLTVRNEDFLEQVSAILPTSEKLLVVCGEGLRSLLAVEELSDGGYSQLAWLIGGFNNVRDDVLTNVEGSTRLRFATLGGVSEYLLKISLALQQLFEKKES